MQNSNYNHSNSYSNSYSNHEVSSYEGLTAYTENDDNHFKDLTEEEQQKSLMWLKANVFPRKTPLRLPTSYGMKHVLQFRTGIYMTNNQFKEAMLICGFKPVEAEELNWWYCVSKKSPICSMQKDCRNGLFMPECVAEYASSIMAGESAY